MTAIRRRFETILAVITVAVAIATIGWLFGPSGEATGVEFSPDRFCHRSFRYETWCGIQVMPKQTHEWQSKVDQYVHSHGYVVNANVDTLRWDFVKGFAPGVRGWSGRAKHMCQAIGCWNDSDEWVVWSEAHPDLAAVVWPQVVTWARNDQYYEIGELFRSTELEKAKSPEEIREKMTLASHLAQN